MTNNNDIDDFTATYLLGSTQRQVSSEDTTNPNYFETEGGGTISPDLFFTQHQQQPRTMSQVSKESFDLSEAEREAHEFMNQLQSNASSDENMRNSHQDINELSDTRRKSLMNFNGIREDTQAARLRNASSLSRSVNDLSLSSTSTYRPNASLRSNRNNNNSNHYQLNRFSCYGDFDLTKQHGGGDPALFMSSQRDVSLPDGGVGSHEKNQLNELQQKYTRAIHDFKLLRSTLTENMERQLTRTEQIEQFGGSNSNLNNNNNNTISNSNSQHQQQFVKHSHTQSDDITDDKRSVISASSVNLDRINKHHYEGPQYRSQDNIYQQQQTSDVILRSKKQLESYHSSSSTSVQLQQKEKELLNRRYSEMNLDEKYHSTSNFHNSGGNSGGPPSSYNNNNLHNQSFPSTSVGNNIRHHPQHNPQYNNNYDLLKSGPDVNGGRPTTYHGLDSYAMTADQQREYQSLLRDQAAKSNFERYLKGSFNSHQSFDHLNHLEDPGYGGSGSTSPRDMDSSLAADRMSSRSGSIASRQSQSSAFAASVDSGVRMSYVGQHNSLVVVAIDFGTTFSGYAFSFTRDTNSIHMMRRWEGGDPGVSNQKTPTTLLLKPDGVFHSFGFGARDFYHDLDANDAKKWMYFDKFKMTLHGSEVRNYNKKYLLCNMVSLSYYESIVMQSYAFYYEFRGFCITNCL